VGNHEKSKIRGEKARDIFISDHWERDREQRPRGVEVDTVRSPVRTERGGKSLNLEEKKEPRYEREGNAGMRRRKGSES